MQHFLLVALSIQGHISPARELASRLARVAGARVTLTTGISAHRRMFPSTSTADDGLISYLPHDDGSDNRDADDHDDYMQRYEKAASPALATLIRGLAARGRPVTCVIYTILLTWAADVANGLGIPSALFWIQPAAVFVIYHRYYHGHADLISISAHKDDPSLALHLPGLPPLQIRDIPTFLTLPRDADTMSVSIAAALKRMFQALDGYAAPPYKPIVLVNSFDALEPAALSAVDEMELMAIGPVVGRASSTKDLFEEDRSSYMEWLDSKEEGSVVYVSFGSLAKMERRQVAEMARGLAESGRPYLWVVRRDNRQGDAEVDAAAGSEEGMVVEWCSQAAVLSHRAVGCFVTHCGWNSMSESMVWGVPMVMVPQAMEQLTNAGLAEREWGMGVRAAADEEGVVERAELLRCLDIAMGEEEMKKMAATWRDRARDATAEGGSSDQNLRAFLKRIGRSLQES